MPQKKIFISHNSEWKYLNDFSDLIQALGCYPVVVEKEADLGKNPDDKSKHYLLSSDMVVFVITKDAVDSTGRPHPKSNVAMEIAWADTKFKPEQKIFFVEEDAMPPSMVTKTYIKVKDGNYYASIALLLKNISSVLPFGSYDDVAVQEKRKKVEQLIKNQRRPRW